MQAQIEAVLRGIEERTPHEQKCDERRRSCAPFQNYEWYCICDRPARVRAEQARTVERLGNAITDELWMAPADPSAERRGALAGPESAAEHVRNALQLANDWIEAEATADLHADAIEAMETLFGVRERLRKALTLLEGRTTAVLSDEGFERLKQQPPRGAADVRAERVRED